MDKENMDYYSAIRKNELELFARKWRELEITMVSKISQAQKANYCMWSLTHV
jgi:hypothetical protein